MAGFGNPFTGNPGFNQQITKYNPQQQNLIQLLGQLGQQNMQNPYQGFAPIAQQARNQFSQQTIPGIAERFTSMGSGGALSSPAFASQLGQAGSGLEEHLAALQAQYGQGQQQFGLQQAQLGLQQPFDTLRNNPTGGIAGGLASSVGPGLGVLGGAYGAAKLGLLGAGAAAAAPAVAPVALAGGGILGLMALLSYLANQNQNPQAQG